MIVYVTSKNEMKKAFKHWIEQASTPEEKENRNIVEVVFNWFMDSDAGKPFQHKALISFPMEEWELAFHQWIENQVKQQPDKEINIRKHTKRVLDHMKSSWGMRYKIIVSDSLDEQERECFAAEMAKPTKPGRT